MTQSTVLFKALITAGLSTSDATLLDTQYQAEPEFLEGMEAIARLMALKEQPGSTPPAGEPWASIFAVMVTELQAGTDYDSAWRAAINGIDTSVQFALTAAVQLGMKAVQDLENQKGKKKLKTAHFLKEFKNLGYSFRMNQCDDSIEVIHASGDIERINDGLAAKIYRQMADRGFIGRDDIESCYIADAYMHRYHPVREYLNSLQYDGGAYIQDLAGHFADAKNVFPLWLRKWLIGAVAKAFTGSQNAMLVLDGNQNLGKSTFARWLCSPLPKHFSEGPIDPDNKDHLITLIGKWIWEVTEVGSTMRKADQDALKAFLTYEDVTVRVPYGRYAIQKPAMASFVGTVNNVGGILNDATGSRRFNIATLTGINWDYIKLDVNKVWSEAVAAYLAGEKWSLTEDERKIRDEINSEYQVEDPLENLMRIHFKLDPTNLAWWMSSTEIIKVIEDPARGNYRGPGTRGTTMALAEAAKRMNLKKGRQNSIHGYFGIAPSP